ncbi:hypothetical protein ANN_19240 [Periplaneta americana]|uniref:Uncharacterized protein n=1 Tax=Periplaneta americana TaxID=6978 RepID=A0ABQ8SA96_PERAM|nr:hypothetical protein ANN_19240 [Periplaneta americana]
MKQTNEVIENAEQSKVKEFYRNIKDKKNVFNPKVVSCRDDKGNILSNTQDILSCWTRHFKTILSEEQEEEGSFVLEWGYKREEEPPDIIEIKLAINEMKNNRAAGTEGLQAELFKCSGIIFLQRMKELLSITWKTEKIPTAWSEGANVQYTRRVISLCVLITEV